MTISALLERGAREHHEHTAIDAPDRAPLSYGQLLEQVLRTARRLRALGVERDDRVAIALPNGPEMAVAFLAVASCATAAPLNPAYRAPEFQFYLDDLDAALLIVAAGSESPAVAVAASRGIPVVELVHDDEEPAGRFQLQGTLPDVHVPELATEDDIALVLHTSGTTARPKIVSLTHRNVCASASNVGASLALSCSDSCLNVMPLFHIHGLIAALLASLESGGRVICTPGFVATEFFTWMSETRPTWYTAVPTMHQSVLRRAGSSRRLIEANPLRFVRSSSASLAPSVMAELETTFAAPVVEAYGMTEAAHQMCCNPLPPKVRKPGSVGLPAGPEVHVVDERGRHVASGDVGEVAIRGHNVTPGYAGQPEATRTAFQEGWFRTGDQGYLDADGYLFLTGRLKEIINRGGETIAPREIDEVLMSHPAVAQALAFAVPDERLGEAVAAAVVLDEEARVDERALRRFAAERLADHKVPAPIVFIDEIPKGPTGKLQRIGLAERLGVNGSEQRPATNEDLPPETGTETTLAEVWREVLQLETIGRTESFFDLGGDSILAARVLARLEARGLGRVPMLLFSEAPTLVEMANALEARERDGDGELESLLADLENLPLDDVTRLLESSSSAD